MAHHPLHHAVQLLGGPSATSRLCGVTPRAVSKWLQRGRLPRTEATGETRYIETMVAADSRIDAEALLATVMRRKVDPYGRDGQRGEPS